MNSEVNQVKNEPKIQKNFSRVIPNGKTLKRTQTSDAS